MNGLNAVIGAGVLFALLFAVILYRAQKSQDNPIDLAHVLLEGRRTSARKLIELLAFFATTWVLLWLTVADKLTEAYFWIYAILWPLRSVAGPLIQAWAQRVFPEARGMEK